MSMAAITQPTMMKTNSSGESVLMMYGFRWPVPPSAGGTAMLYEYDVLRARSAVSVSEGIRPLAATVTVAYCPSLYLRTWCCMDSVVAVAAVSPATNSTIHTLIPIFIVVLLYLL